MKFKAAILKEINQPLVVEEVEVTPLQIGQVLVEILISGLCGAQLQEIAGLKGNAKFVPHLLGHEGCGIVREIGPGVTKVNIGDKVVMHWRVGNGIESPFPKYIYKGKEISSGKVTTLSEYSIVSENRLTPVNEDTSETLCCLLGCSLTTALGSINNEAQVKFGESVLVIGAGGVGLSLIQGARMASAYPIYTVDINDNKRKLSHQLGATSFFNNIGEITWKCDVIFDTTGNSQLIGAAIPLLSNAGRLILVGQPKPNIPIVINNGTGLFNGIGQTIKATQGGKTNPSEDIPRYVRLFTGPVNTDQVITHTYDLQNINQAINLLKSGDAGRIMIKI